MNRSLGILGGLGPLASAEFLKTIYEFNVTESEQESPACILYSDPTFPNRIDAILGVSEDLLVNRLVKSLESLYQLRVSKVVIACITIHYFLPKVPLRLREKVISLIDLIFKEVLDTRTNHLLLCSNGVRKASLFQKHPQWKTIEKYLLWPDEEEQAEIQSFIYEIKKNRGKYSAINNFISLLSRKYQINSFIAGCTEFHLLTKYFMELEPKEQNYYIVDPLLTIAKNFQTFMDA